MLFQTNLHFVWEPRPNGQAISENVTINHAARYEKDFDIWPETSDVPLKLTSAEEERQALMIVSDAQVLLNFGNGQVHQVGPGNPLIWHEATRQPCTIRGDFTQILATNLTRGVATVRVRIAERDVPAAAPVPAPAAPPTPLLTPAEEAAKVLATADQLLERNLITPTEHSAAVDQAKTALTQSGPELLLVQ